MTTYKIKIEYEGTRYKGWQRLSNSEMTIQFKIESVLSKLLNESIQINGSGRTDAGVHARAQVASFKIHKKINPLDLMNDVNKYLPEDIAVTGIEYADDDFHARFNAKSKRYSYQIWTAYHPPVFERNFVLNLEGKVLDLLMMEEASKLLVGTHDFKGFSTDKTKKSTIRRIESIKFIDDGNILKIEFTGDGFLYNMVRIIVGTLIEIGLKQRDIESIDMIFSMGKRELAGETAPAKGLFLVDVTY